jgi:hypothetical protein
MYDNLQRDILSFKNKNIILGGDWNASFDCSPVNENIDVLNMEIFLLLGVATAFVICALV